MNLIKDNYVDVSLRDKLPSEKLENKEFYGIFKDIKMPEYTDEYQKIINRFK
ncbi:2-oxoglutarate synthase subunit korB domain protein [[Clostridium] sordellii ATCC 9714]|nr:2-oxoglutarate synthase subunit korB domain protein [[Clostridium] sordellii ATCC 9714] [Paeniclostridium sordellii ATCC 9714]